MVVCVENRISYYRLWFDAVGVASAAAATVGYALATVCRAAATSGIKKFSINTTDDIVWMQFIISENLFELLLMFCGRRWVTRAVMRQRASDYNRWKEEIYDTTQRMDRIEIMLEQILISLIRRLSLSHSFARTSSNDTNKCFGNFRNCLANMSYWRGRRNFPTIFSMKVSFNEYGICFVFDEIYNEQ